MTAGTTNPLDWPDDQHLTRTEAAAFIGAHGFRMSPGTLAKYAWRGDGPPMTYFGSKPFYRVSELRAWMLARTRRRNSTPPRKPGGGEHRRNDDGEM